MSSLPANLLSGLRILLLEDEYLIAMDVEMTCRENGAADVVVKRGMAELGDDFAIDEFDVAIVDLMLSGTSTMPFARRLSDSGKPFIFASGYVQPAVARAEFPNVPVIGKPYSDSDLVDALAEVTGRTASA